MKFLSSIDFTFFHELNDKDKKDIIIFNNFIFFVSNFTFERDEFEEILNY